MRKIKDFIETALIIIFSLALLLLMIVEHVICTVFDIVEGGDE